MAFPFRDEHPSARPTWATWSLIALCVLTFAYLQPKPMQGFTQGLTLADRSNAEQDMQHFVDRWALVPCEVTHNRSIADGAACDGFPVDNPGAYTEKNVWIPFVTALFLHGNLLHLLSNMIFLWLFGRGLEERIGAAGVFGLFLAGGLASFLGYVAVNPESTSPLLGASGAIAAIMGAYFVLQPDRKLLSIIYAAGLQIAYLPAWAVLGFFFVSQFFTAAGSHVAWQAHVAGMIFGIVVGFVLRIRMPQSRAIEPEPAPKFSTQSGGDSSWLQEPPVHPPESWHALASAHDVER